MDSLKHVAAFLMLLSLISIQVHDIVPHHHHADDAPEHVHQHHHPREGMVADHSHGPILEDALHPDLVAHDEHIMGKVAPRQSLHVDLVIALPVSIDFDIPERFESRSVYQYHEHPWATGPPGITSARAPPFAPTA